MSKVICGECKYSMYSDCYLECGKGYKGIVNYDDSCRYGVPKKRSMPHTYWQLRHEIEHSLVGTETYYDKMLQLDCVLLALAEVGYINFEEACEMLREVRRENDKTD